MTCGRLSNMEGEAMNAHDRHHCKECNKALVEGRAYELGGYRWHVDCFVCSVCSRQLNADTNMLVLGNGTLVCNNCSYYCNMCHTKIEKLAILTNDQAFCSNCFICRNCKKSIEDLKYARTPHGIFCMSCHNLFMARKLQRQSRRVSSQSHNSAHRHKQLPELPGMPRKPSSRTSSTSTVPQLGSPLAGTANGTPLAGTPKSATKLEGISLHEDSGSEYEIDPSDWEQPPTKVKDDRDQNLSDSDVVIGNESGMSQNMERPARVIETGSPNTSGDLERQLDTLEKFLDTKDNKLAPSPELATRSPTSHASFKDNRVNLEPTSSKSSGRSIHSNRSSIRSYQARRSIESTRSSRDTASMLANERGAQTTPVQANANNASELDTPSDFHSACQSLDSTVERPAPEALTSGNDRTPVTEEESPSRDLLASPIITVPESTGPTQHEAEPNKFDSDFEKALLTSPPPRAANRRSDLVADTMAIPISLPVSRGGSPAPLQMAPRTPLRDIAIPPRSPARSPSRAASPLSVASSVSYRRSPEMTSREQGSPELRAHDPRTSDIQMQSPSLSLTEVASAELSVPKRSNLRGLSPKPRNVIAHASKGGPVTTSAPGPLPTSPRWNRNQDGINSIAAAQRHHKRSLSDNQNITTDNDTLLRSLIVAQHRIRTLETKLSSQNEDSMLERKSTIASLEARRNIANEELTALKNAATESKKDENLSEFSSKLTSMKDTLEKEISDLVAEKERLKAEVDQLVEARDKAIEESSLLNIKNTQLADMNNELLRETMEKYGPGSQNHQGSRENLRDLREKRKPKRKEVGSGTRAPSSSHSQHSIPAHTATTSTGGPSPYVRPPSAGPHSSQGQSQGHSQQPHMLQNMQGSGQFVTVLNPQEQNVSGDRKNKLWPWKRMQRGTPRTVELDDQSNVVSSTVTHLNGSGGVSANSGVGSVSTNRNSLLGESLEKRVEIDGTDVPIIVTRCIEEVEKRGLELEGIYRKSGSKSQIDALMELFETQNGDTTTLSSDISAVTSALKQYLRYLKDPVITYQHYDEFVRAGRSQNIPLLRTIVSALPPAHNRTLAVLIAHLASVKEYGAKNLMTTVNLATVFAPTLTRDITGDREMEDMQARNDATQLLIDNYGAIFE